MFEVFDQEPNLWCIQGVALAVLATYTWSFLQFTLVFTATAETVPDTKVRHLRSVLDSSWANHLSDFSSHCLFITDCSGTRLNHKVSLRWRGNRLICRVPLTVFFFIVCAKFEINHFVSVDLMCREKGKKKPSSMYYVYFRLTSPDCLLLSESTSISVAYLPLCNVLWFRGVENWRFQNNSSTNAISTRSRAYGDRVRPYICNENDTSLPPPPPSAYPPFKDFTKFPLTVLRHSQTVT